MKTKEEPKKEFTFFQPKPTDKTDKTYKSTIKREKCQMLARNYEMDLITPIYEEDMWSPIDERLRNNKP